jgi:hypothetical protein
MHIESYSQRLLNPFRGIVNTIRHQSAEAVSTDGVRWDVYVSNESLLHGLERKRRVQISDIRYGHWTRQDGLVRGPIFPSEDFRLMEEMGAVVYEHLISMHDSIPFTFDDTIELWLLNESGNTLALLDSVVDADDIELDKNIDWRAGQASYRTFHSEVYDSDFKPEHPTLCAGEYLTRYINECAGAQPSAQWFLRAKDGSGTGLDGVNINESMHGRILTADNFPNHMVNTREHDQSHTCLINDYIDWLAPWLLLLPDLNRTARQYFERQCRKRALEVDKQYIMYPEIIDESMIKSARVEAMLRRAQPEREEEAAAVMSTFYVELAAERGK